MASHRRATFHTFPELLSEESDEIYVMDLFARSVQHSRVRSVVASSTEKLEHWDFITLADSSRMKARRTSILIASHSLGSGRGFSSPREEAFSGLHETVRFTTDQLSVHLYSVEIHV